MGQAATRPQDLRLLTMLRFFAALWVVLYHYWPSLGVERPALVARGYLGVEVFFVLSGFILAHVYLEPFGRHRFSYVGFLWARLARIYPVHLFTLASMAALVLAARMAGAASGAKTLVFASLPAQLLLLQAWGLAPWGGWNHPSWSISAEWFAYLAFPLFAAPAWWGRTRPGLACTAAAGLLIAAYAIFPLVTGLPLTQATLAWGAFRIVPCFLLGCALHLGWSAGWLANPALAALSAALALAGLIASCATPTGDVAPVLFGAGLILSLAALSRQGGRSRVGAVLVYLGEVSFSLYMVCIPWQDVVEAAAHKLLHRPGDTLPIALWGLMLAGVVPAAMALHHGVERPARDLMRRLGPPGFHGRDLASRRPGLVEPEYIPAPFRNGER